MRKIIDTNMLQSHELRAYLAHSDQNFAVLTDYSAMETLKGDTLAMIFRSMEVVAAHPKQVIVLKDTTSVCGLSTRNAGLQRRMIDEKQTRAFAQYCRDLSAAQHGDTALQAQLLDQGREATAHLDRMHKDAAGLLDVFGDLGQSYTPAELTVFRTNAPYSMQLGEKMAKHIMHLAANLLQNHPRVTRFPGAPDCANTFIFRYALCGFLLWRHWVATGRPKVVRTDRLRNDVVDASFAAYATFFDGLLTADRKLTEIYLEATQWLRVVFSSTWSACDGRVENAG